MFFEFVRVLNGKSLSKVHACLLPHAPHAEERFCDLKEVFLLQICNAIVVQKNEWGIPELLVDWGKISQLVGFECSWRVQVSCSHEGELARWEGPD